jgi:hypothetical protein
VHVRLGGHDIGKARRQRARQRHAVHAADQDVQGIHARLRNERELQLGRRADRGLRRKVIADDDGCARLAVADRMRHARERIRRRLLRYGFRPGRSRIRIGSEPQAASTRPAIETTTTKRFILIMLNSP